MSSLSFRKKIEIVRKILFKADPYIIISKKPKEMVQPRPEDYVFEDLRQLMDRQVQESALAAQFANADPAIKSRARKIVETFRNNYLSDSDIDCLYQVVSLLKPRRIVEVGSGNSTRIMRQAARDGGFPCEITAIDPAPRADIAGIPDVVVTKSVVGLDKGVFGKLLAGDVFFIDGSHYTFNGTDATFLFLEVLPRIPSGVIVHVHDICLPYEYSRLYTGRSYNEQYLVAALLLGGGNLRVDVPVYYRYKQGLGGLGASLWMTRV